MKNLKYSTFNLNVSKITNSRFPHEFHFVMSKNNYSSVSFNLELCLKIFK